MELAHNHTDIPEVIESSQLIEHMLSALERPTMFGNPENIEAIGKHVIHIYLSIIRQNWTWDLTQELWQQIGMANNLGRQFSEPIYEADTYRKHKWGDDEAKACKKIVDLYEEIWHNLKQEGCSCTGITAEWIESLFCQQIALGSPDNADVVLWFLINFASRECNENFQEKYKQNCIQIKGVANRGLQDVDVVADWYFSPRSKYIDSENHSRVKRGILLVLQAIEIAKAP